MGFQEQYPMVPPGRAIDVEREMREMDEAAGRSPRNLTIMIVVCVAMTIVTAVRGLPSGAVLFGTASAILTIALALMLFVRRRTRRTIGTPT